MRVSLYYWSIKIFNNIKLDKRALYPWWISKLGKHFPFLTLQGQISEVVWKECKCDAAWGSVNCSRTSLSLEEGMNCSIVLVTSFHGSAIILWTSTGIKGYFWTWLGGGQGGPLSMNRNWVGGACSKSCQNIPISPCMMHCQVVTLYQSSLGSRK